MLKQRFSRTVLQGRGCYGTRRLKHALAQEGLQVSRRRIGRLLKEQGLSCKRRKKRRPCTTDSHHSMPVAPNHLDRQFSADQPNPVLCGRYYLHRHR